MNTEEIYDLEHLETKRMLEELDISMVKTPFEYYGKNYYILATNNFDEAKNIGIILPGIPEKLAFWSYSLIKKGEISLSSKYQYFNSFIKNKWGLINLTPHLYYIDTIGRRYIEQLDYVLKKVENNIRKKILIGYSFGGRIAIEIVMKERSLMEKIDALILLDPVVSSNGLITKCGQLKIPYLIGLSEDHFKRYAIKELESDFIFRLNCSHGELPNRALKELIKFIKTSV